MVPRQKPPPGSARENTHYQTEFTASVQGAVIGDYPLVQQFFASPPLPPGSAALRRVRFRLPRVVEHFVGRDPELAAERLSVLIA